MKIYGPIYLVVKHQGEYDEYRKYNLCAYKNNDLAFRRVFRLQTAFAQLYDYYKSEIRKLQKPYPDLLQAPDEVFAKWHILAAKADKFSGVTFEVEIIELIK